MKFQYRALFAALGLLLLMPSIGGLHSAYLDMKELFDTMYTVKQQGQGDAALMAGAVSHYIVGHVISLILYLPGIIVVSVVAMKYKYGAIWFSIALAVYSFVLLLNFPLASLLGIYTGFLSRRIYRQAKQPNTCHHNDNLNQQL